VEVEPVDDRPLRERMIDEATFRAFPSRGKVITRNVDGVSILVEQLLGARRDVRRTERREASGLASAEESGAKGTQRSLIRKLVHDLHLSEPVEREHDFELGEPTRPKKPRRKLTAVAPLHREHTHEEVIDHGKQEHDSPEGPDSAA
jgi:hypothetical protein